MNTCWHCGKPQRGYASVGPALVCHPDDGLDCYRLVISGGHPMPCPSCADPFPACPGEFHGADGGACEVCGWDSHALGLVF